MNGRKTGLKALLYAVLSLVLYVLQAAVFTRLSLFGVKPLILPVAVVCIALFEGSFIGGIFGLVCGVLCDFTMSDTLVLFTVSLTLIGFGVGILSELVLARGFPSCMLCSAAVLLICAFLQSFRLLFFFGASPRAIASTGLLQSAYSILFTLPLYLCVRTVSRRTQ